MIVLCTGLRKKLIYNFNEGVTMPKAILICLLQVGIVSGFEIANLGHTSEISKLRLCDSIGFSQDVNGYWAIWNLKDNAQIKSIDSSAGFVDFINNNFINKVTGGIAVYKYPNLTMPQITISDSGNYNVSIDGKFIWFSSNNFLRIWNLQGIKVFDLNGNYLKVKVNIDSSNIYVSKTDSTCTSVSVYSISTKDLIQTIPFDGVFHSWFLDGHRFMSIQSTIVRVYSKSGVREVLQDIGDIQELGGYGNYYWKFLPSGYPSYAFYLYKIGANVSPISTINTNSPNSRIIPAIGSIGILTYGIDSFTVVRLLPDSVNIIKNKGSGPDLSAFAIDSSGKWLTGNKSGVVNCGVLNYAPQSLNYGKIRAVTGIKDSIFAAATSSGCVLIYKLQNNKALLVDTFAHNSSGIQLSSDGNLFASQGNTTDAQYSPDDLSLVIYNVSTHSIVKKYLHNYFKDPNSDYLRDFDFSPNGDYISQRTSVWDGSNWNYSNSIIKIANDSTIFQDNSSAIAPRLSPTYQFIAITSNNLTKFYSGQSLNESFGGTFLCWLTDDRIIATKGNQTVICNKAGKPDSTFSTLYQMQHAIIVTDTEIYDSDKKQFLNIKSGKILFQLNQPTNTSYPVGPNDLIYTNGASLQSIEWRKYILKISTPIIASNNNLIAIRQINGILYVKVASNQSESYSLNIFELNGKLVLKHDFGYLNQGIHMLIFNLNNKFNELLHEGMYAINIWNGKGIISTALIHFH
jgi:hypothetical protein